MGQIPLSSVAITGLGLSSAFGALEPTWRAILEGRSAARWIGGERRDAAFVHPSRDRSGLEHLHLAADEAVRDSEFGSFLDPARVGTVVGFSKGDVRCLASLNRDGFPASPFAWPLTWPGGAASALSSRFGFQGPCLGPVAACASGLVAVLQAARLIQQGACDVVLAGAGDSAVEPLVMAALKQMRVLARIGPESDPCRAVRPFDRRRSGFLPGEGAALLVLESAEHARRRGFRPWLELSGGAFGSDAYHLTDLDPDPQHLAALIERGLEDSGTSPGEIDLVHPHATATGANDRLEALALRQVFGPELDRASCWASKPQIGHLLGASGAAELVLTCLALRDGLVPATLNREEPEPGLDLPFETGQAQTRPLRSALKLAIGFGGHLAAAVVRRTG